MPYFFDAQDVKDRTFEIPESEIQIGDGMILMVSDIHIVHHFEEYTGPLDFVSRIAKFTDGRGCSLEKGHYYRIVKRS